MTSNSPSSQSGAIPGVLAARCIAAASPTMLPAVFESAQRMPFISHSSAIRRISHRLVRFDLDRRMLFDFPQRVELIARHRLLENFHTMIGQTLGQTNGSLRVIGFVGVDLDEDIVSNGFSHRRDAGKILFNLPAYF